MDTVKLKSSMKHALNTHDKEQMEVVANGIRDAGFEWVAELSDGTLADNIDFFANVKPYVAYVVIAPKGRLWG